ncbi:NAD-dependent dehydratase [Candidatus Beckwithbacteria bacterium RBG_13_42_9]|uniref:UDP-glucuronate decarboxylase n=1 Tax=Candidatus Beckwithbacteria bacterium RBG_13_42_9 TaxID=1797457 RepID=A0A1F5E7I3_9BACT|nr:MAG: NAD-dependent dehydratase [Candidatus Beckwithbacteria bacterium RBG_13_42_9]
MNVLVTGGAGLIGSHLIDRLLEKGHQVTCVDNFITGRRENIAHLATSKNFSLIVADASLPLAKYQIPNTKYDYIFHLASPASPKGYMDNPIATYKVNSFGTHYLLELAQKQSARFLYASTSEVYGDPKVHPQPESYWGNVNPNGPRSCYDESKRFGEMACKTFKRLYNLDVRIVRIFNTYGPRNDPQDGRVIPNFIIQALQNKPITVYGKGEQTRSFCYVSDLVDGLMKMMFSPNSKGELINLGNPEEYTVLELAKKIKELTHSSSEVIFGKQPEDDPNRRKPEISKAQKLLNWQPKISLEEGLRPTIAYFQKLIEHKL